MARPLPVTGGYSTPVDHDEVGLSKHNPLVRRDLVSDG